MTIPAVNYDENQFNIFINSEVSETSSQVAKEKTGWFETIWAPDLSDNPDLETLSAKNWNTVLERDINQLEELKEKLSKLPTGGDPALAFRRANAERAVVIQQLVITKKIMQRHANEAFSTKFGDIEQQLRLKDYAAFARQEALAVKCKLATSNEPLSNPWEELIETDPDLKYGELQALRQLVSDTSSTDLQISLSTEEKITLKERLIQQERKAISNLDELITESSNNIKELKYQINKHIETTKDMSKEEKEFVVNQLFQLNDQLLIEENYLNKYQEQKTEFKTDIAKTINEVASGKRHQEMDRLSNRLAELESQLQQEKSEPNPQTNPILQESIHLHKRMHLLWREDLKGPITAEEKEIAEWHAVNHAGQTKLKELELASTNILLATQTGVRHLPQRTLETAQKKLQFYDTMTVNLQKEEEWLQKVKPLPLSPVFRRAVETRLREVQTHLEQTRPLIVEQQDQYQILARQGFKSLFMGEIDKILEGHDEGAIRDTIGRISQTFNDSLEWMVLRLQERGHFYKWKNTGWSSILRGKESVEFLSEQIKNAKTELSTTKASIEKEAVGSDKRETLQVKQHHLERRLGLLSDQIVVAQSYKTFEASVDLCKKRVLEGEARQEALRDKIKQTSDKIKDANTIDTRQAYEAQKSRLINLLAEARYQTISQQVQVRELILNRLIQCVNQNQTRLSALKEREALLNENIERNKTKLQQSSPEKASHIQQVIEYEQEEVLGIEQAIADIQKDIKVLDQTFEKQLNKYESIPRPKKTFQKVLWESAQNTILTAATLGLAGGEKATPVSFRVRKQFADLGYNMVDELKNVDNWKKGDSLQEIIANNVKDFLLWADEHPDAAASLATDIALTVSMYGDKEGNTLKLLETGMRARMNVRAALGELGHETRIPKVTRPDLRYQALADLAKYGPLAVTAKNVLVDSVNGLVAAGLTGMVVNGIKALAGGGQNAVVQKVVKEMAMDQLSTAVGILQAARGASLPEILASTQTTALIALAGNVRNAVTHPVTVAQAIKHRFQMVAETFSESTPNERAAQVAILSILPSAGVSALVIPTAVSLAFPLVIALGIAGFGLTAFTLLAPNMVIRTLFPGATARAEQNLAASFATQDVYQRQIDEQYVSYLATLKRKKIISDAEPAPLPKEFVKRSQGLIEPLKNSVLATARKALEQRLEDEIGVLNDQLIPFEVATLYSKFDFDALVKTELTKYIKASSDLAEESGIVEYRADLEEYLSASLKTQLVDQWLASKLRDAFQHEFTVMLSKYGSPQQWENSRIPVDETVVHERVRSLTEALAEQIEADWTKENKAKFHGLITEALS